MLEEAGWVGLSRRQLNSRLYRLRKKGYLDWRPGIGYERRWYCEELYEDSSLELASAVDRIDLHDWQREALEEWKDHGYVGVVEAVTGAGKTRLAIAAAADVLHNRGKVAILVPTIDLLHQWKREVERLLIQTLGLNISIGILGYGHTSNLARCDLLLSTVQSACNNDLLPHGISGYVKSLLVADEVHRYGSERWALALEDSFVRRLGLTATYERSDNGCEKYLDPYFGGVIFSVDYGRALQEGIIAPFKIAFVGVSFTREEREEYDKRNSKVLKYRRRLIREYGLPEEPFGEFMREVAKLRNSGEDGSKLAGFFLNSFTRRREVLASSRSKYDRLEDLAEAVRRADKTIIFAQTKESARMAVRPFIENGIDGAVLESGMHRLERQQVLAGFENEDYDLVAAPRLLDEGIDVAAADLGIIIAASASRRQMIQRMGRVLRLKEDDRFARLVVLYVEGTSEDPEESQEGFLDLIMDVAHDVRYFSGSDSPAKICRYLDP
ncbi:ATP-dependent RNA helicase DbpA [Rubrobacter xylanophilus DSM 9941]|uniref:DEAD/DEAH box helicase n=1 Tax=Rubrobacter xylanophilus TaxID=49319 RepID=UPI001C63EE59|nr:DEAD/DEAH box helicase [Rubrobacter xylanophilus]QYJ15597.1 ATP-dependent RNA helicase DbpA [Rubrobacter xylanophilus DSM 9941]